MVRARSEQLKEAGSAGTTHPHGWTVLCLDGRRHASMGLSGHPTARRHLDGIHGILKGKSYVEVGFPVFAAAPLLWREFGERLRLVQLVRHPVRVTLESLLMQETSRASLAHFIGLQAPSSCEGGDAFAQF